MAEPGPVTPAAATIAANHKALRPNRLTAARIADAARHTLRLIMTDLCCILCSTRLGACDAASFKRKVRPRVICRDAGARASTRIDRADRGDDAALRLTTRCFPGPFRPGVAVAAEYCHAAGLAKKGREPCNPRLTCWPCCWCWRRSLATSIIAFSGCR